MAGVTALRVVFIVLGSVMVATLVYTLSVDGSPFRKELLIPWMTATLIDFYINVAAISAWVIYKESSWISAFIWVALLICFGSIMTCAYIVKELFKLSPQDPPYLILLRDNRAENRYEEALALNKERRQGGK
ncbi:hypothetical protein MLD38_019365 [Melastoma candidum]|uniref:Uncharacterized protein n=1 Tax=Melastoma candidum TaxID=119954 RepID=A0ACB9QYN4_9MYRT|nr:hypothetical protein MLD38_019365 [Melastoma candidum]